MTPLASQTRPLRPYDNLLAWIAGSPTAQYPETVAPAVRAFMFTWHIYLSEQERQKFIYPLIDQALRTNQPVHHAQASEMADNWLLHINAPAWLALAGLEHTANILRNHPHVPISHYGNHKDPLIQKVLRQTAKASSDNMKQRNLTTLKLSDPLGEYSNAIPDTASTGTTAAASAALTIAAVSTGREPLISTLSPICSQAAAIAIHDRIDTAALIQELKESSAELLQRMCEPGRVT